MRLALQAAAADARPQARGAEELSPDELLSWSELIESRCGLTFGDGRARFLAWCLRQRMAALEARGRPLERYADYHRFVAHNPGGEAEWAELVELVVNQESGFFRHQPSYDALAAGVVPELTAVRARQGIGVLAAWSAGCADGREAYSIAMTLLAALDGRRRGWQVKVCGSDLSERALAAARRGRYPRSRLRGLPEDVRGRWLRPVAGDPDGSWEAGEELRGAVAFGRLNLYRPEDYWVGLQDVVFCQNVLIYFRPEVRERVVADLAGRLRPGGYLFPAPGEVVGLRLPGLEPVRFDGVVAYRRAA